MDIASDVLDEIISPPTEKRRLCVSWPTATNGITRYFMDLEECFLVDEVFHQINQVTCRPVLIALVPMLVRAVRRTFRTLGVLDPASGASLILEDFAKQIGLRGVLDSLSFGSCLESKLIHTRLVKFDILSLDEKKEFHVEEALVVHSIKGSERRIHWPNVKHLWEHLADLELP